MTDLDTDPRFQWWRDALAGKAPEAIISEPQPGFYSMGKGADRKPVVIYPGDNELIADVGFGGTTSKGLSASEVWTRVYSHPITDEVYWDAVDNRRWRDLEGIVEPKPAEDPAAVPFGSNHPPALDPFTEITEEIEGALAAAREFMPKKGTPVRDKALADKLANSRDRIRELRAKADGQRDAEKRPHDEASKAVQLKWKPYTDKDEGKCAVAVKALGAVIDEFLRHERDEAARKQRAAEEAAAKAEAERLAALEALKTDDPPPELAKPVEAPPPPEPVRVGGGYSGRRTGLKEGPRRAIVEDWDALIAHLKEDERLRAVCQQIADAAARSAAKIALPGCRISSTEGVT